MTNAEFLLWLLGYFELCGEDLLNRKKLFIIKNHLNLVKSVEEKLDAVNQKIWDGVVLHLEENSSETALVKFKDQMRQIVVRV